MHAPAIRTYSLSVFADNMILKVILRKSLWDWWRQQVGCMAIDGCQDLQHLSLAMFA